MNYREARKVNGLIDEIKNLDSLIKEVQSPFKKIWVSDNNTAVTLRGKYKTEVIQVLLGVRRELARELEELGVTEENNEI